MAVLAYESVACDGMRNPVNLLLKRRVAVLGLHNLFTVAVGINRVDACFHENDRRIEDAVLRLLFGWETVVYVQDFGLKAVAPLL